MAGGTVVASVTLARKMRKAREFVFEVGGYKFTLRRPTVVEFVEIIRPDGSAERYLPFIVGWEGIKELDMIPGGDPHQLEFDADVCGEWLRDRDDLFGPIINAIVMSYVDYAGKREDVVKNSPPG